MATGLAAVLALAWVITGLWSWRRIRALRRELTVEADAAREREARAREEVRRETAGQLEVFNCMSEGLLVLGADRRVRLTNPNLSAIFNITGDLRGRTLMEALRRHELEDFAERARREGQALGLELEVAGRPPRFLQVNATRYQAGPGGAMGVILVFHDVTRLRALESTRREFVANVSHELRTPLTLIKGYVETLIDGIASDPEVSLRFLRIIEKHANRLTFLIEDLLTVSQLDGGQIILNRQWGELRPLLERVCEDLGARAEAREVTVVNDVPGEVRLRADFDRLQQVFSNLVDNAIKYGRVGGRVHVGARLDAQDGWVEMWVADDGPGIPPESLDRIFERFYRVDSARSRDQGGTGLGLSIVKHIVQAHGGEVQAESEAGKGATFRMRMPVDGV